MDVADVTDVTDVAGVTDITDITRGTVRHMAYSQGAWEIHHTIYLRNVCLISLSSMDSLENELS